MPTLAANGIRIHYEVAGEGEPLLFLHGLGSSSRDWELQVDAFARDYHLILPDTRGHGQTSKPPGPYSVAQFSADTVALLEALAVPPVHVVGLSMGGMIAFQLAVDRPDLLRSMVIVNSAPALVPETWEQRLQIWQRLLLARLFGPERTGQFLSRRLFPQPEQAELRALFVARWAENEPRAYRAAMRALVGWSVESHLPDIHIPTLVIAAEHDYSPVAQKEVYVAKMPHATLRVVPGARHALPVEKPETFNALVAEFLAAH